MALKTTVVRHPDDIRAFFDTLAPHYGDCHGPPDRLLRYRLGLIQALLRGTGRHTLVEIGCGTGLHLFPLAASFTCVIGTDLAPGMIAVAAARREAHPCAAAIALRVDPAETLATVGDATADAVLCVGALEHMPDQAAVLRQAWRILKPGGAWVCLTPNGGSLWYRWLAPRLGLATRHLSTDRYLGRRELAAALTATGFRIERLEYWTFIPRGDLPLRWAWVLQAADWAGRIPGFANGRGGLAVRAVKPQTAAPGKPASAREDRSGE